jgi:uncharacterized membrane protein YciS (DUF1049 family)
MDILKPSLTEPGIKYFLHQTLKQCHITKNTFHTTVFNVGMLLGFMILLAAILFFKYKGKITPAEKHKKDYEKQQYILSKITKLQQVKRAERQELITGLPNWENEYDTFNKNPYS